MPDIWDFNISYEMSVRVNGSISNSIAVKQQYSHDSVILLNVLKRCHDSCKSSFIRLIVIMITIGVTHVCYAGFITPSAAFTFVQKRLLCSLHTTGGGGWFMTDPKHFFL